jgi:hypothetical protein
MPKRTESDAPRDAAKPEATDLALLTARSTLPYELRHASGMQKLDWIWSLANPAEFVTSLEPQELYYWMRDERRLSLSMQLRAAARARGYRLGSTSRVPRSSVADLALAVDHDTAAPPRVER